MPTRPKTDVRPSEHHQRTLLKIVNVKWRRGPIELLSKIAGSGLLWNLSLDRWIRCNLVEDVTAGFRWCPTGRRCRIVPFGRGNWRNVPHFVPFVAAGVCRPSCAAKPAGLVKHFNRS